MAANAEFQVESIRRMLDLGDKFCVVYVCGGDKPSWNALAQLARTGDQITMLSRGAAAQEVKTLAATLPNLSVTEIPENQTYFTDVLQRGWPVACNVLLIDEYGWQRDFLRDTLASGTRPAVIATRDGAEDAKARQFKYALLTQTNYFFAGLSGEHSLWTANRHHEESSPTLLTDLPAEIRALPVNGPATVELDKAKIAPGTVLRISARADFGISGWAMVAADQPPASDVFARARHDETGVEEYMRLPRESRRDVADHFQTERLLMTGFRADLSPLVHRIGTHSVSIIQSNGVARYESATLFQFALAFQDYEVSARIGLANRYMRGSGIEIGALQKPTQLNAACQVRYIDRMSLQKLLEHYPEMAQIPVQAPDIVDDGQLLTHIAEDSQDFAIANHFLEHCPDPIRSIHNMLRVVKVGGILFLAVPDKRHTFDLRRPVTPYAVLKNAYISGQRRGTAELFYEWAHLVYNLPPEQAKTRAEQLIEEDYSIHYNVWATSDLLNFLMSAQHDFQSPFELVAVVSSENETIVLLERTAGRLPI